jgi:hypothetical protein
MSEFVRMVSSLHMDCNKAAVEDKGCYFNSELVLVSSNKSYPAHNSIREKAAIWRRRHLLFYTTVKPEYRMSGSEELDKAKTIPGSLDHYLFHRLDPNNESPVPEGEGINYASMEKLFLDTMALHRELEQKADFDIPETLTDCLNSLNEVEQDWSAVVTSDLGLASQSWLTPTTKKVLLLGAGLTAIAATVYGITKLYNWMKTPSVESVSGSAVQTRAQRVVVRTQGGNGVIDQNSEEIVDLLGGRLGYMRRADCDSAAASCHLLPILVIIFWLLVIISLIVTSFCGTSIAPYLQVKKQLVLISGLMSLRLVNLRKIRMWFWCIYQICVCLSLL